MALIQTDCCGLKSDKYKLTCKNLAGHDECPSLEGYNVTVVWNYTGSTWTYTDADGCVSTLHCEHPDTNEWHWSASVTKLIQNIGSCHCILDAHLKTDTNVMPATLPSIECYCHKDGAYIQVEAV